MDDIVILAGGECKADMAAATGVAERSEIQFRGRTFLQIAIDAVAPIGSPLVVGGVQGRHDRQVSGGKSFVNSLRIACDSIEADRFLLVFADLPFLTTTDLTEFVSSSDPGADVNYPIVPLASCLAAYPTLERTAVRVAEGEFTGGNVALLKRRAVLDSLPLLERLYAARKSPLKLAGIMGVKTLALLIKAQINPSKVRIEQFERTIGAMLNLNIRGVRVDRPAIGTDIDSADQYRKILQFQDSQN